MIQHRSWVVWEDSCEGRCGDPRPDWIGGPGGNRTPDQRLRSPLLYPLSYGPASNWHILLQNAWRRQLAPWSRSLHAWFLGSCRADATSCSMGRRLIGVGRTPFLTPSSVVSRSKVGQGGEDDTAGDEPPAWRVVPHDVARSPRTEPALLARAGPSSEVLGKVRAGAL